MNKQSFILKNSKTIIISTIALLIVSVIPLLNVHINSDLMTYLNADIPAVKNKNKVEEVFGKADPIMIVFEAEDVLNDSTLRRIKALSHDFNRMNDFDMVMSLFDSKNIKGEDGAMIVDPVVKRIPKSEERRERLREEIRNNELAYNFVVSSDFRYTIIILNSVSNKRDGELMELILETLKKHPGMEKVLINGQPYLRAEAQDKIATDFMILLPVGLIVMAIFLWVSFREKRGVFLPAFVVIISIVVSLALIPVFGWDLSVIGILIPVMMIAIANDYGIHFIAKYQELNAHFPEMNMKEIVVKSINYLKKPVILTGITTIVGISGLVTHVMLPAKQMGIVSGIGIGFALLASLTFIPAIMLLMKKGKPHSSFLEKSKKGCVDKILIATGNYVARNPRQIVYLFVSFMVAAGLGLTQIRIASDFDKILPEEHSYNISLNILNKYFNGTKNINLLFTGDIKDPELLKRMIQYETEIEKIPGVGAVNSIASMIKIMSRALNEPGDEFYDKIPDSRNAVAQYLELYAMSGDPDDFEDFVDFDYQNAVMQIQFQAESLENSNMLIEKIKNIVKDDDKFSIMGGMGLVENRLSNAIAQGQITSLVFAFVAIFLLLVIIFRSLMAGFLGSFPLLFAIVCNFGIMGWIGIELDIITALLSSISIGLGVDYTIHIFWRMKDELQKGKNYAEAITISLKTSGRGITINAFSVIVGFSVLFLSGFPLIHLFAFLIILSIVLCLVSALALIPALSMLLNPAFLKHKKTSK